MYHFLLFCCSASGVIGCLLTFVGQEGISRVNMPVYKDMIPIESASSDSHHVHVRHLPKQELSIAEQIMKQHPLQEIQATSPPSTPPLDTWQHQTTAACLKCRKKNMHGCNYEVCKGTCLDDSIANCKACINKCTSLQCASRCI